jgi:diaminohydroxyphosphoribosylaminopyrimidine deaminase/5-amino-6-(5-phosphoribosylamino)uracil reductase
MTDDEKYMLRCLDLAALAAGKTYPNPMVGAVIVSGNRIIGEGYHHRTGAPHAEVLAIQSVKNNSLLRESTLYLNLEPCSHYGKTPPCSLLIREKNIPKVVVGTIDTNPMVHGKGIQYLRKHGITVTTAVLEKECRWLNRRFFTFHEKQRPYVILKWAQSADGFLDSREEDDLGQPAWITGEGEKKLVHKWRMEEQAIMVGTRTAEKDNPRLTVREWSGRNPLRLVIDRKGKLSPALYLFDQSTPTIVFTEKSLPNKPNIEYCQLDFSGQVIPDILTFLYRREIQSLVVEGGGKLLTSFLEEGWWDESRVFTGRKPFRHGIHAPAIPATSYFTEHFTESCLDVFLNTLDQ